MLNFEQSCTLYVQLNLDQGFFQKRLLSSRKVITLALTSLLCTLHPFPQILVRCGEDGSEATAFVVLLLRLRIEKTHKGFTACLPTKGHL